jgi:ComF family protein
VYRFPIDALIQALKYGGRLAVARFLARAMMWPIDEAIDVIVPMPLSEARQRERGFNQAHEIARHIGRMSGIAVVPSLCRRVRETPPQAALPWKARAANVRGAFVAESAAGGLRVAVIDDVATTGATLNEVSRVLKHAGTARVVCLSAARALKHAGRPPRRHGEFGSDPQTTGR